MYFIKAIITTEDGEVKDSECLHVATVKLAVAQFREDMAKKHDVTPEAVVIDDIKQIF